MAVFTDPHKKLGWAEFCNKISSNIICTHECKNAENEERKKRKIGIVHGVRGRLVN